MRFRIIHLLGLILLAAIGLAIVNRPIEMFAANGLYSDDYIERVVLKNLKTLPKLPSLTCQELLSSCQ